MWSLAAGLHALAPQWLPDAAGRLQTLAGLTVVGLGWLAGVGALLGAWLLRPAEIRHLLPWPLPARLWRRA